ncbi:flavodoxin domain-containing protein [Lacisediminihabitans sp.]|uniref:flavodoxin domain-containing protein n=1 Tax=Lacisediminihabitans sp. TaxID=2787631 RepID=UPI00374CA2EF
MKALVIYESMFGSTRRIAEQIAAGLAGSSTVVLVTVHDADPLGIGLADLIVVGAPTHLHGMSMPATRAAAVAMSNDPQRHLALESGAVGGGVREWLETVPTGPGLFAAFDTRRDMARILTGAASVSIGRSLARRGLHQVSRRSSFLVDDSEAIKAGELERARAWGERIGRLATAALTTAP